MTFDIEQILLGIKSPKRDELREYVRNLEAEIEGYRHLYEYPMYSERCPRCEGLDDPGIGHNPKAPYCTEYVYEVTF